MSATRSFSITLPADMAQMVEDKVSSGEYASENEVIREGLRALAARDAVEEWLREEVAPTYDAAMADPGRALPGDKAWRVVERHMDARVRALSEQ